MNYYKSGNHVIGIDYDDCAENPREYGVCEYGWHLVCAEHSRYDLPHEAHETMNAKELSENPDYEVVPLSFLDHSGIMLMQGIHEGWDVCQCGYAWRERGGYDSDLQDVLDIWNLWANGEVLCAILYDLNGNMIDSLGGLYENSEHDALKNVVENYFDVPGFNVETAETVEPTYTMSF